MEILEVTLAEPADRINPGHYQTVKVHTELDDLCLNNLFARITIDHLIINTTINRTDTGRVTKWSSELRVDAGRVGKVSVVGNLNRVLTLEITGTLQNNVTPFLTIQGQHAGQLSSQRLKITSDNSELLRVVVEELTPEPNLTNLNYYGKPSVFLHFVGNFVVQAKEINMTTVVQFDKSPLVSGLSVGILEVQKADDITIRRNRRFDTVVYAYIHKATRCVTYLGEGGIAPDEKHLLSDRSLLVNRGADYLEVHDGPMVPTCLYNLSGKAIMLLHGSSYDFLLNNGDIHGSTHKTCNKLILLPNSNNESTAALNTASEETTFKYIEHLINLTKKTVTATTEINKVQLTSTNSVEGDEESIIYKTLKFLFDREVAVDEQGRLMMYYHPTDQEFEQGFCVGTSRVQWLPYLADMSKTARPILWRVAVEAQDIVSCSLTDNEIHVDVNTFEIVQVLQFTEALKEIHEEIIRDLDTTETEADTERSTA